MAKLVSQGFRRSHWCGEVGGVDIGAEVQVAGWVHRRRNHGGVIFLDVRDRSGLVQVVVRPEDGDVLGGAGAA